MGSSPIVSTSKTIIGQDGNGEFGFPPLPGHALGDGSSSLTSRVGEVKEVVE